MRRAHSTVPAFVRIAEDLLGSSRIAALAIDAPQTGQCDQGVRMIRPLRSGPRIEDGSQSRFRRVETTQHPIDVGAVVARRQGQLMVLAVESAELLQRFLRRGRGLLEFTSKELKRGEVVDRERDVGMFVTEQAPPKVDRLAVQGGGFLVATLLSSEDGQVVHRVRNQPMLVAVDRSPDAQRFLCGRQRVGQPAALARRDQQYVQILGHVLMQVAVRTPMLRQGLSREAVRGVGVASCNGQARLLPQVRSDKCAVGAVKPLVNRRAPDRSARPRAR